MPKAGVQFQLLQEIGNPGPTEGRLHGHGCALGEPAEPLPHGIPIDVFQASAFDYLLAFRGLFHYTDFAKLTMDVPS